MVFYQEGTLRFSADSAFVTLADSNTTVALSAASGHENWRLSHSSAPLVTALSADERTLFVLSGIFLRPGFAPTLVALDTNSGEQRWEVNPTAGTGRNIVGGLSSAAGDSVLLLSGQGMGANALLALDTRTGTGTAWSLGTDLEETLVAVTPLLVGDLDGGKNIFACAYRVTGGGTGAVQTLYALDRSTGTSKPTVVSLSCSCCRRTQS